MERQARSETNASPVRQAARLVLLVAVITLPSLPTRELLPTDEPRFALVARQMVEDPAPLIPHLGYDAATLGGEVYSDKPPIFFWLISLFSAVTGGVNETSTRLPSFFGAIAAVLLTWRLGRLLIDDATGFAGALILATSSQFFQRAAWCSIDMLLTSLTLAATFCWLAAARGATPAARIRLAALGGFFAAAGTLSKGPVGLIFPLAFLAADRFASRFDSLRDLLRARPAGSSTEPRVSNAERPTGNRPLLDDANLAVGRGTLDTWRVFPALVAGVIAYILPVGIWICAIFVFGGRAYAYDILFHQNVTRYVAAWNNVAPWYYYFYRIPLGLFPWTLLLPAALLASRGLPPEQARPIRGLLIACATLFVFFTISTGKRGVYVLPLYFALALLIAAAWRRTDSRPLRIFASAHVIVLLVLGLLAPVALPAIARSRAPGLFWAAVILGLLFAATAVAAAIFFRRGDQGTALTVTAYGVALILFAGSIFLVPEANRRAGVRAFGAELASVAQPGDFLVVDQEGYEQILFYAHLKGTRRDFDITSVGIDNGLVTVRPKLRKQRQKDPPQDTNDEIDAGEEIRATTEAEDQRRVTRFPPGSRVLFVVKEERADRIRSNLGPDCRTLLGGKLYGKPYLVLASHG